MKIANAFGYNQRSEVTEATMGTNSYVYDPIGDQKSAKPKAEPQGDRDFEAVLQHGARSGIPRRSGNCNRLTAAVNAATNVYASNPLNQYTNLQPTAYSQQPSYDSDGNMLTCALPTGEWHFFWDGENRLVCASNAATVVRNTYDHRSRRIRKEVYAWDAPSTAYSLQSTTSFLWDNWNVIRETVQLNSLNPPNSLTNYYTWGVDLSGSLQGAGGVGGLLAVTTTDTNAGTSTNYYPVYDANGNVTAYLDAGGSAVAAFEYDAFGNTVSETAIPGQHLPFRFSTKYRDIETGMYDYGRRFDITWLARWANRDPSEEAGGLLLYGFLNNNPLNNVDFLGLFKRSQWHKGVYYLGHDEFSGDGIFDYNVEDDSFLTKPELPWGLPRHFKIRNNIEPDLDKAICGCDKNKAERLLHQWQDTYVHSDNDWSVGTVGHLFALKDPDFDNEAWTRAESTTVIWVGIWHKQCCRKKTASDGWIRSDGSEGCCD